MSGQYPGGGYNSPLGGHRGQQQMINPMNQLGVMQMGGYGQGGMMQQQNPMGGMPGMGAGHVQQQQQQQMMQHQQQMQMHQQQQQQQQMNMVGAGNPGAQTGGMQHPHQQQQPHQQQHQQQQQQPSTSGQAVAAPATTTPRNTHNQISTVGLSLWGQETVQDITTRFQEIFSALKIIQPTANRENNTEKKVQEYLRTIRLLFKRLRILYEKCNDSYPQGMEYTQAESLIPYKDEPEHRVEPVQCEEYRKALQENQELIETVKLKNRQLREIIDRTRIIIWEINTMLSMRRS